MTEEFTTMQVTMIQMPIEQVMVIGFIFILILINNLCVGLVSQQWENTWHGK